MTDPKLIDEFERSWKYICGMRDAFINGVPENRWQFSHHPKFAPLVKQFKHVIKVYGSYVERLRNDHGLFGIHALHDSP
jgi:hypothetical protein